MKNKLKKILSTAAALVIVVIAYFFGGDLIGQDNGGNDTNNNEHFVETTFVRTVDGDTIVVKKDGKQLKVRFIGINAPESVHNDESKNTEEGKVSSAYLKSILTEGETLYLEYDEEREDTYGRKLAYVWTSKDVDTTSKDDIGEYMLNAVLVKGGYAEARKYPPNLKYHDILMSFNVEK